MFASVEEYVWLLLFSFLAHIVESESPQYFSSALVHWAGEAGVVLHWFFLLQISAHQISPQILCLRPMTWEGVSHDIVNFQSRKKFVPASDFGAALKMTFWVLGGSWRTWGVCSSEYPSQGRDSQRARGASPWLASLCRPVQNLNTTKAGFVLFYETALWLFFRQMLSSLLRFVFQITMARPDSPCLFYSSCISDLVIRCVFCGLHRMKPLGCLFFFLKDC